jgi:hypothetical protein
VADPPSAGAAGTPAEPAAQTEEKTSDWFAPRKSAAPKAGSAGGGANGQRQRAALPGVAVQGGPDDP